MSKLQPPLGSYKFKQIKSQYVRRKLKFNENGKTILIHQF